MHQTLCLRKHGKQPRNADTEHHTKGNADDYSPNTPTAPHAPNAANQCTKTLNETSTTQR
ncbi:TPA: hypothetical protein ACKLO9_001559 [Neisseria gonorrhoeae]